MLNKLVLILFLSCLVIFWLTHDKSTNLQPTDTIIKQDMEDGSQRNLKRLWLENIHQAIPDMTWQNEEHQNAENRYADIKDSYKKKNGREVIADGSLVGSWTEQGSSNQAGSVHATAYNPTLDELFLISDGGILFKGDTRGQDWVPQNEFVRLDNRFLAGVPTSTEIRLVSAVRGLPKYSLDKGQTWLDSEGITGKSEIAIRKWVMTEEHNEIFILRKPGWWDDLGLYVSLDTGKTYLKLLDFNTSDLDNFALCSPLHTTDVYLMEQVSEFESKMYKWNRDESKLQLINEKSPLAWGTGFGNLVGTKDEQDTVLYTYLSDNSLWKSTDEGKTWNEQGNLPVRPWEVGLFISSEDPQTFFIGEVEAYKTSNAGFNWTKINSWSDYYDDVNTQLHADIMYFSQYKDWSNRHITLVSNHGGISKSYDDLENLENIGKSRLNVSQYYDVVSHPIQTNWVFAGSQDQGYQRGLIDEDDMPDSFDQVISGDYGHITFTREGNSMWMVYPGGNVHYYSNAFSTISNSWSLESRDESVWIPPLVAHPDPKKDVVYLAGGNVNGGGGSYIIELTATLGIISTRQLPFNFLAAGLGTISAMAFNNFDRDIIYVATTQGGFWASNDGGETFEQKQINVPHAHYLYGADILPSANDPNIIYVSGSGYGPPAVIQSVDGGETFERMNNGLPNTLAFELAANYDESLLFAATEAGPYVYVTEKNEWFHMGGVSAPTQTYWSVEYLQSENRARFGTYGRGIWDFQIEQVGVSSKDLLEYDLNLEVFPNPTVDFVTISCDITGTKNLKIVDAKGAQIMQKPFEISTKIYLTDLNPGIYFVIVEFQGGQVVKKIKKI